MWFFMFLPHDLVTFNPAPTTLSSIHMLGSGDIPELQNHKKPAHFIAFEYFVVHT